MKNANKLQWEYKCSNREWWRVTAEMDRKVWNKVLKDNDWIREVRIERQDCGWWIKTWEGYVEGQYDMPIGIEDVLREWMADRASWAMGFVKYGKLVEGEAEDEGV